MAEVACILLAQVLLHVQVEGASLGKRDTAAFALVEHISRVMNVFVVHEVRRGRETHFAVDEIAFEGTEAIVSAHVGHEVSLFGEGLFAGRVRTSVRLFASLHS